MWLRVSLTGTQQPRAGLLRKGVSTGTSLWQHAKPPAPLDAFNQSLLLAQINIQQAAPHMLRVLCEQAMLTSPANQALASGHKASQAAS